VAPDERGGGGGVTASLVPYVGLVVMWAAVTWALRHRRRWLLYYLVGALGFILLVVYGASLLGLDKLLESIEATQVAALSNAFGIRLGVLGGTGLAIPNHTGWAVFDIGVECSAILETSAILGLIGLYPRLTPLRRIVTLAIGLVATYELNLMRILIIVWIINYNGTGWVFPAHAVFGRMFFFLGTVLLYWYLVTRPTVSVVRRQLEPTEAGDAS
jgi:exosortase family protein XrtG